MVGGAPRTNRHRPGLEGALKFDARSARRPCGTPKTGWWHISGHTCQHNASKLLSLMTLRSA